MRAITAGTTFKDNIELSLYYDDANRGYSEHGYIGLYNQKSIRAIGKLTNIIQASCIDGVFNYKIIIGDIVTEEDIFRIKDAMKRSERYGYNIGNRLHNYFVVEKFIETNFRKESKDPIQKSKFFDLSEILNTNDLPSVKDMAKKLNNRTWEEFES